ncbi:hypothetical protein HAX54_005960 [Datura stramonium]|uniref:Myb-like domain-containing protein n=1 Tax=Datura stramonium TaxID=4076 RepID=A0ABS8RI78_DATST|nr:hypothetical protein [Datura stramonium]
MFGGDNGNVGPFTQRLMFPQHPLHLLPGGSISAGGGGSSGSGFGGDDEFPKRDERVPPWSNQETRDFIAIRGELEKEFSSVKRSNLKNLWEIVAAKMTDRGYRRSAEQCKSKWKNLVNRYKVLLSQSLINLGSYVKVIFVSGSLFGWLPFAGFKIEIGKPVFVENVMSGFAIFPW